MLFIRSTRATSTHAIVCIACTSLRLFGAAQAQTQAAAPSTGEQRRWNVLGF